MPDNATVAFPDGSILPFLRTFMRSEKEHPTAPGQGRRSKSFPYTGDERHADFRYAAPARRHRYLSSTYKSSNQAGPFVAVSLNRYTCIYFAFDAGVRFNS
ncbi:hypothetical protein GCM10020370_27200 [Paenibacillus hodogayensis]